MQLSTTPGRYRKVALVEAMQILHDPERNENLVSPNSLSIAAVSGWMIGNGFRDFHVIGTSPFGLRLKTLEGEMEAGPGYWILRGSEGEFWPVREDIFAKTYEKAEDD